MGTLGMYFDNPIGNATTVVAFCMLGVAAFGLIISMSLFYFYLYSNDEVNLDVLKLNVEYFY